MNRIAWRQWTERDRKRCFTVFVAVFIWGLVAHAYGVLNLTISHDSLNELFASKKDILHRVGLGRFMVPVYQLLFHGRVSLPWLNGLLALCWISVSVWLTACIFSIEDTARLIFTAGIFTVNITVTALTATYIHDLDADMFAVMLAVFAAFLWHRGGRTAWIGVPLLSLVLGFYQSVLSVFIALVMFVSIMALLRGEKASEVVRKGLQAIIVILLAGGVYLVLVKLSCLLAGTELSSTYNGLTKLFESKGGIWQYFILVLKAYYRWVLGFSRSSRSMYGMLLLHAVFALPTAVAVIYAMRKQDLPTINKLLVLALGALLPLGMNISYVLDGGMDHDLMHYASWLIYLFAILITEWYVASSEDKKLPRSCSAATVLILSIILATDVQTANNAYIKKDLERQATLSVMTSVRAEMNRVDNYIPGETPVVFIGKPQTGVNEIFPNISNITGVALTSAITYADTYDAYFRYILQAPFLPSENEIPEQFTNAMTTFPEEGCIQWYDNILVVKLS